MSRIALLAVCVVCLALAPADQPAAPKSLAARAAIAKHQKAVKDAKATYERAVEDANAALKVELDKALKIALKNQNLDEANAIKGVVSVPAPDDIAGHKWLRFRTSDGKSNTVEFLKDGSLAISGEADWKSWVQKGDQVGINGELVFQIKTVPVIVWHHTDHSWYLLPTDMLGLTKPDRQR